MFSRIKCKVSSPLFPFSRYLSKKSLTVSRAMFFSCPLLFVTRDDVMSSSNQAKSCDVIVKRSVASWMQFACSGKEARGCYIEDVREVMPVCVEAKKGSAVANKARVIYCSIHINLPFSRSSTFGFDRTRRGPHRLGRP